MNIDLILKDPITVISIIIGSISFIFILILSYIYKKQKEQKIISDIVSEKPLVIETSKPKSQKVSSQFESKIVQQDTLAQNFEIIISQLNELSKQINFLSKSIEGALEAIDELKATKQDVQESNISADVIAKLVSAVEQIHSEVSDIAQIKTSKELTQINEKLDNLLKLIATLLEQ